MKSRFVRTAPTRTLCPTKRLIISGVAFAVTIVTASKPDRDAMSAVITKPLLPNNKIPMFDVIETKRKRKPNINAGLSASGEEKMVNGLSRVVEVFLKKAAMIIVTTVMIRSIGAIARNR